MLRRQARSGKTVPRKSGASAQPLPEDESNAAIGAFDYAGARYSFWRSDVKSWMSSNNEKESRGRLRIWA